MIVCLGWGSLVWNLNDLPVEKLGGDVPVPLWTRCAEGEVGDWKPDGPTVKVEFVRRSQDGCLTLVLYATAEPVPSLWARMTVDNLDAAVRALAKREGSKGKPLSNPERDIGRWSRGEADPKNIPGLEVWAIVILESLVAIAAATSTSIGAYDSARRHPAEPGSSTSSCGSPRRGGVHPARRPGDTTERLSTKDQAVAYLRKLSEKGEDTKAKKYVRQTPQQIDTAYRRCIVRCLGPEWEVDRE